MGFTASIIVFLFFYLIALFRIRYVCKLLNRGNTDSAILPDNLNGYSQYNLNSCELISNLPIGTTFPYFIFLEDNADELIFVRQHSFENMVIHAIYETTRADKQCMLAIGSIYRLFQHTIVSCRADVSY